MSEVIEQSAPDGKYMIDSYGGWAAAEGVPIITAAAVDLLTAETGPWARFATRGAICHLTGRGDFLTLFLFELPPSSRSARQHHLYEEVFFGLSGRGATIIETADGRSTRLDWGPGSLFAVPMNARHRHLNESGREPARLASVNDLRYLFNVFRNEEFVFANPANFPERVNDADRRDGARWETGQALDLSATAIGTERHLDITLAQGSIGAALHELPPGTSQTGPHVAAGCFLFGVTGRIGLRREADGTALDLRPGLVTASPPDAAYRLSNAAAQAARLLAVRMGSARYPLLRTKRNT